MPFVLVPSRTLQKQFIHNLGVGGKRSLRVSLNTVALFRVSMDVAFADAAFGLCDILRVLGSRLWNLKDESPKYEKWLYRSVTS